MTLSRRQLLVNGTLAAVAFARVACGIMNTPAGVDKTLTAVRILG